MFQDIKKRAQKAGQPPGTFVYTGNKKAAATRLSMINYSAENFQARADTSLEDIAATKQQSGITWVNIQGLQDISIIENIGKIFNLHPLTVEDILNVEQRPKVEEFLGYEFITFKMINWHPTHSRYTIEQLSIVMSKTHVLTFQESDHHIFNSIREKLGLDATQRLRQQGSDYLTYRLIDTVVDFYFVVLEALGNQIDKIEESIIKSPTHKNSRAIYRLKRQILALRKSIWPMREVISHLLQSEEKLVSSFTRLYMRDLYDHIVQAIDTVETYRDILSNLLDVYLSALTARMNEVMKTLTIIATIFIPITFVASLYGMNFLSIPELHWRYGYYYALGLMLAIVVVMLIYFRNKDWI